MNIIKDHQVTQTKTTSKRKFNETLSNKNLKKQYQKKCQPTSPIAGPSRIKQTVSSDSASESDDDISEEEKCCVCHEFQPIELKQCVSLVFTKWAQRDIPQCNHWTNLVYCYKQRVVRRHDKFVCPCHAEE